MNTEKKLISLEENDRLATVAAEKADAAWRDKRRNGVACPSCGQELYDGNGPFTLLGFGPPVSNVHCTNQDCSYAGQRLVQAAQEQGE